MKNVIYEASSILPDIVIKINGFYTAFSDDVLEEIVKGIFEKNFPGKPTNNLYFYHSVLYDTKKGLGDIEIYELKKSLRELDKDIAEDKVNRYIFVTLTVIDEDGGNSIRFYFIPYSLHIKVDEETFIVPAFVFHKRFFSYDQERSVYGMVDLKEVYEEILSKYENNEEFNRRITNYLKNISDSDRTMFV